MRRPHVSLLSSARLLGAGLATIRWRRAGPLPRWSLVVLAVAAVSGLVTNVYGAFDYRYASAICDTLTGGRFVGHGGTSTKRANQYEAILTIEPREGAWKITGLQLLQEEGVS